MTKTGGEQPVPHSHASTGTDGRMRAPSAGRNTGPILKAMAAHVPADGIALELASGTGEHAVAYARRFPQVTWQPTDIAADRLASIDAWRAAERVENLRVAQHLDASGPDWQTGPFDLVVVVNLFHLVSESTARNVIGGVARSLRPGGRFFVYGPFRTGGRFRSAGDQGFHQRLQDNDAAIGYKDLEWIEQTCATAGLARTELIEMPANNLSLVMVRDAIGEK